MQKLSEVKKQVKRVKEIKGIIRRIVALQLYDVQKCYGQYVKIRTQTEYNTCRFIAINTSNKEVIADFFVDISETNEEVVREAFTKLFNEKGD